MSKNKLAGIEREKIKVRLTACYEAYKRKEPSSADRLMLAVRALAYTKVYHLEHDFKEFGSTETADDWAQDVCVNVWSNLDQFKGTPSLFYSWVCKIAFHKSTDAFRALKKESKRKVQLFIDKNDGDGEDENAAIYRDSGYQGSGPNISAFVRGKDRDILNLIGDGCSREEIAEKLEMTTCAIATRLSRLRDRIQCGDYSQPNIVPDISRIDANKAFDLTMPQARTAMVSGGHMRTGGHSFHDRGHATYTANPFKVKPSLSDFVIDVENTARKVLTPGEFLYFKRTYLAETNDAVRIPRVDAIVRLKVGTALIEYGISPFNEYMNHADLDVRKAASTTVPTPTTPRTQAPATACAKWAA